MIAAILSISREDNLLYYLFSLISISAILFAIILVKSRKFFSFNTLDAIFLVSISSLVSLSMLFCFDPMGVVLFLLFLSFVVYFKMIKLSVVRLLRVVNITYLFYLLLSIISYSGLIFAQEPDALNSFIKEYGFISFETLYGLEGSTASIDSYSALIILVNLFLNKKLSRYMMIIIALFALLLTTRFTPIIMFLFSIISYVVVRNRILAVLAISSIFLGFFSFSFLEMFYPNESFFIENIPNSVILNVATHGRTFIWSEQLESIANNFNGLDFLIGNYKYAEVLIPWGEGSTSNSHNSFFSLFFRIGIAAIFMILFFIRKIFYNFDRRTFPVIFGIFLSATTNGTVFYVGNPVFLLVLIYLTYFYKEYNIVK
tara:strand:+ start:1045 stop:2160 length:1116 start_codon:yes stop_codon:yes gene_type:complete